MPKDLTFEQNLMTALRSEILELVESTLTPLSRKYCYIDEPLEQKIRWQPCVLILGNYSSGKSTFINEILGTPTQRTGQAPTDDSFTVIAHDPLVASEEVKDGKVLLGSETYPFAGLRKFGNNLASHFVFKRVNNPAIEGFAMIDTPGMLDSVSERDRGYDYQKVLAELAQISDLILVMFDPHKAGTIRETYESLRETLPKATYEDRVLFVLNRVDECQNLNDLIRVYGTLCWNLSHMTGRKDIPQIRLTWAPQSGTEPAFLTMLGNQRQELCDQIRRAPKYRLDHMVSFVEEHSLRMQCLLQGFQSFQRQRTRALIHSTFWALGISGVAAVFVGLLLQYLGLGVDSYSLLAISGVSLIALFPLFELMSVIIIKKSYFNRACRAPDEFFHPKSELEREGWNHVRKSFHEFISHAGSRVKFAKIKKDVQQLVSLRTKKLPEIRKALEDF